MFVTPVRIHRKVHTPVYFLKKIIPHFSYKKKISRFRGKNPSAILFEKTIFSEQLKGVGARTISIYFLHVYENKYYIQVYLENCTYKIVDNEIVEYILIIIFLVLMKINFLILMNGFSKCYITIKLTYVK